jgi:uncharacterized OB-fold protein
MFKWFGIVNHVPHTKVAAFADHLREGRLMASRCRACGRLSFPPRADCEACLAGEFEWVEISGRGRLHTFTRIHAAPRGFEAYAPYTLGLLDLEDGGRALAWVGDSVPERSLRIGMELRLVPRMHEDREEIVLDYTLESPDAAERAGSTSTAGVARRNGKESA